MMIVDTPGFQNPEWGGSARGASFEELCHNYAQDRLQRLFHERTFLQELERYKEVGSCPQGPAGTPLHLSSWSRILGRASAHAHRQLPALRPPSFLFSVFYGWRTILALSCVLSL